jgi:hypothetical protein
MSEETNGALKGGASTTLGAVANAMAAETRHQPDHLETKPWPWNLRAMRRRRNTCLSSSSAGQQMLHSKKRTDSGGWSKKLPARITENDTCNRPRTLPQYRLKKRVRPTRFDQEAHENCRPSRPDDGPPSVTPSSSGLFIRQCNVALAQQCLNFLPEPHGHGSFRPTLGVSRRKVVAVPLCRAPNVRSASK